MEKIFKITLEAARVNARLRQREAAEKLGITVETLRNYEVGRTSPTVEMADKLCTLYNVPRENINFFCKRSSLKALVNSSKAN